MEVKGGSAHGCVVYVFSVIS